MSTTVRALAFYLPARLRQCRFGVRASGYERASGAMMVPVRLIAWLSGNWGDKKGCLRDMTGDSPDFHALPGATPENSAFIDLHFDPSVSPLLNMTVPFTINGRQFRLSPGQSTKIAVPPGLAQVVLAPNFGRLFYDSMPRLDFVVHTGQTVPVFYRYSTFRRNPGSLTFQKLEGRSPSEQRTIDEMKYIVVVALGMVVAALAISFALSLWS